MRNVSTDANVSIERLPPETPVNHELTDFLQDFIPHSSSADTDREVSLSMILSANAGHTRSQEINLRSETALHIHTLERQFMLQRPGSVPVSVNNQPDSTIRLEAGKPESTSSDCQLANVIRERLFSTGYQQLRGIDVFVDSGHVRLRGRVGRYYLRQLAQHEVLGTSGVSGLQSEIEVVRAD